MLKTKKSKKLFLFLLLFTGLFFITVTQQKSIHHIKQLIFVKKNPTTKIISFQGYVLVNNKVLNKPVSSFKDKVLIQTGNNSLAKLAFFTNEIIEVQPNSQLFISQINNKFVSILLKAGNLKLIKKNLKANSTVLYKNKLKPLSKWLSTDLYLNNQHTPYTSKVLKKAHLSKVLTERKPKEAFFYLIKKYKKYFLYCQANAIRKKIKPTGKMLVNLHILNNKITDTYIISSTLNPYLQTCALAIFKKMKLKFHQKQDLWIRYPLYFK